MKLLYIIAMTINDDIGEQEWKTELLADPQAILSRLFDEYRDRLKRMVQYRLDPMLARRMDIDDVVQEAYLAAVTRAKHLAEHGPKKTFVWLRWIVDQTLVDIHRRHLGAKMRDVFREQSIDRAALEQSTCMSLVACLAAQMTSPSGAAMRNERAEGLRAAIASMDSVDREVLMLRHFEELSNQQVAEILDIQETAASNRYVRALRRLKEILDSLSTYS
jgi:RNA polymerase sigma-70 factor, ECF subfamily